MREIKFKAKATKVYETSHDYIEIGDFVYGYYYYCTIRNTGIIVTQMSQECGGIGSGLVQVEIEVKPETVCQFTGLTDTNNKKLFERDIMDVTSDWFCNGEIVYREGEYRVALDQKHGRGYDNLSLLLSNSKNIKIGNKFDGD